ncbi:MAG: S41 family peptidase [Erysipelotrichia bacterium]|jgi:carboxyl-terminal processing protease|nr:S41 family peptidase [Erysipelotrichia bacterium]
MEEEKVVIHLEKHRWPDEVSALTRQRWTNRLLIVMVVVAFLSGWLISAQLNVTTITPVDSSKYARLDAIINTLSSTWFYGKDIENIDQTLIERAIKGMIEQNGDPYTEYFSPEEYLQFSNSITTNFVGIGVQIYNLDGITVVEKVFRNSPAESFGVLPGDIIYKVDGVDVTGMAVSEIASMVRGERNTVVSIEFIRGNTNIVKDIVRDQIRSSAFGEMLNQDTAILEIYQFGADTADQVKVYLDFFKDSNAKKLIIDLRDNGGGFLDTLLKISAFFLDKDTLVIQQQLRDGRIEQGFVATQQRYTNFENIVVLVNQNSASASEVLAAALSERGNMKIVGVTSFGKGTVQITRPFSDGSALKVTTAQWLSPDGNSIQGTGITPDVEVFLHPFFTTERKIMNEEEVVLVDSVSDYVMIAQMALDFLNYNPGRMDGYFSLQTLEALNAFAATTSLGSVESLTPEVYRALYTQVYREWYTNRRLLDPQLLKALELLKP